MNLLRVATLLLFAVLSSCRRGNIRPVSKLESETLSDVSWKHFCGCLHMTVTSKESAFIDRCYEGFFNESIEIKRAIQSYSNKHQKCFESSKVNDEECKVCDLFCHQAFCDCCKKFNRGFSLHKSSHIDTNRSTAQAQSQAHDSP